jgi:hypothetical protein
MHKTFRALGAVGALLCFTATLAVAQNNSDHNATSIAGASVSGFYTPGNRGRARAVTAATVANEERILAGGSAAERQVGAVLSGGSPVALANALIGAGAPAAQVNALMAALNNLGANPSPEALRSAIRAYNDLVHSASQAFVNNPPPQLAAIRAALIAIRAGV